MFTWNFRFDRYGQSFRYQLHRRPGDALIVFFPGLRGASSKEVEYYNRLTWSPFFGASCLYVADPCLAASRPELRGSWFQGGKEFFAVEKVAQDIRAISGEFGFSEGHTVLYGSSQGGFTALALGAYLTGANILAECPQSDVRLFNLKEDTNRAAKFCYGANTIDEVSSDFDTRLNLTALYRSREFVPKSRILVKKSDTHAVDLHVRPLESATNGRTDVHIFDGALGEGGHSALPKEVIIDEINALLV